MRDRHWEELTRLLGKDMTICADDSFTLSKLIALDLDEQIETVQKQSDVAGKEFAIEQAMDKMEGEWKGVNLDIQGYRETGTFVLKGFDVIQALLDDHIVMKRYFRDHVGMDKYKLATRMFEMVVDLHGSIKANDTKRALGRVATMYQFIEQYVVDKGDLYVASLATHMPEPDRYLAEPREKPIGKLKNRNVTAIAGAYQRDLDVLRKARDERAKK